MKNIVKLFKMMSLNLKQDQAAAN